MSITLEDRTARRLRHYAQKERLPVSQVVEMAIERLLERQSPASRQIITSPGRFNGSFSREETYEGR